MWKRDIDRRLWPDIIYDTWDEEAKPKISSKDHRIMVFISRKRRLLFAQINGKQGSGGLAQRSPVKFWAELGLLFDGDSSLPYLQK